MKFMANIWVQATPDCASLFFLAQESGAPEPQRGDLCIESRTNYFFSFCFFGGAFVRGHDPRFSAASQTEIPEG